ncbi:MAG: hypothetical protein WCS01_17205, partial [bacterium]
MKRYIWLTAMAVAGASLCSAQDMTRTEGMAEGTGSELTQEAAPWRVSGGLVYKNWLYEHDALQQRAPMSSKNANDWEGGDTDGNGSGIQAKIGRGDGCLNVAFTKSDFTYALTMPGGHHEIETTARDFEASWSQIRGRNNQGEWGSTMGFRYLGMQKSVTITEGNTTADGSGNMNWMMFLGGYDGNWRPFDTPTFQA